MPSHSKRLGLLYPNVNPLLVEVCGQVERKKEEGVV